MKSISNQVNSSAVKEAFKKVQNLEIFSKFISPHPTPTLLFSTGFHCYFFYLNVEEEILHPLPKKINSNMNSWVIQGNFLCSNGSASLFIKFTKDLKLFWFRIENLKFAIKNSCVVVLGQTKGPILVKPLSSSSSQCQSCCIFYMCPQIGKSSYSNRTLKLSSNSNSGICILEKDSSINAITVDS